MLFFYLYRPRSCLPGPPSYLRFSPSLGLQNTLLSSRFLLQGTCFQSGHPSLVLPFLLIGRSGEALYCFSYQSAFRGGFVLHFPNSRRPSRLCTAFLYPSALRGGFVLHFPSVGLSVGALHYFSLSVGPSIEDLYRIFYQSARPSRLVLYPLSVGPSVEALARPSRPGLHFLPRRG
jgi:hypothetical protein